MIEVIWGTSQEKPVSSKRLADDLARDPALSGYLYIGYPVIGTPTGPLKLDGLLVSPEVGLVAFDLVEGLEIGDFQSRQDEIASMLDVRLKPYPGLKNGRQLKFDIHVVTYCPAKPLHPDSVDPYFVASRPDLLGLVKNFSWDQSEQVYKNLVGAIQVVTSIRAGKQKREPKKPDSRGAKLKRVEDSIANLDQYQSQAVIETVEGVQRIRGLAGSGKTIVLALKVAYLHAQNPTWRIGITFNTRSLKEQFKSLINSFTIEQTGAEPDWDCIDIINAWGGPGDRERDGIYHKFCRANLTPYYDFGTAKNKFGEQKEFQGVCAEALAMAKQPVDLYDMIMIDEAQDLPVEFLRLCFVSLPAPHRLVYAYDELQSLTGSSMPPAEELFGNGPDGKPMVRLNVEDGGPRQDIILEKCYRNSRPLLATAHALGFGIYREKGLVQIFDEDGLWTDVGYVVEDGALEPGSAVSLARTDQTSPEFLESHSPIEDLIQFLKFDSPADQAAWLVKSIKNDLYEQELRPEDIVVINPNPLTTKREVAVPRQMLFSTNINSELSGVSTAADIFRKAGSVTFTGVFRAKGNEAGMVYIMNAQDCASGWDKTATALGRNRLFTAITRSKAWVRVLGHGPNMDVLMNEFQKLHENEFKLRFIYPTDVDKKELRVINKTLGGKAKARRQKINLQREQLLQAVERGEVDPDQLIIELEALKHLGRR
ncbi:DEAD/DEAH box helicase [Xanthomonas fragariae]|uniref:DEAD/DEAH box helicase n=1 Tax=Xanthomonas fragariae TaxID=48664 RepID=UPI0022AA8333|nr:ATP-binding domain-containing protein [Xanthomonas fragariae]WAT13967.1 ATP-binding domain-containing protein [Xanthomonas fragariae]